MRVEHLLSSQEVPISGYPCNSEAYWLGMDSMEAYRANGGHPSYGEDDISYVFNERGYRGASFSRTADIRMMTIGCSWAFGQAVPQKSIFHELFATRLRDATQKSVISWNLGIPGASNDSIARLLHYAMPVLKPDIVLVLFTHLSRREYVAADDYVIKYTFRSSPSVRDPATKKVWGVLSSLSSKYDDQLNFFRNYKSVEACLSSTFWLFSFVNLSELAPASVYLDSSRQAPPYVFRDKGRDHVHPGALTHQSICETFWETFIAQGALSLLRESRCR